MLKTGMQTAVSTPLPQFKSLLIFVLLTLSLTGCQQLTNAPEAISHDGLKLVSTAPFDAVYRNPSADFSDYKRMKVNECAVSFRKNWKRDQNSQTRDTTRRVTDEDMNKIRSSLAQLCRDVFIEELQKDNGYPIVDAAAADVLELRPSITNLDINAPDTLSAGSSMSFTTSEGSMSLYLEVYDSVSGEILGRVLDRKTASDTNHLEWTNAVTNAREAKRILVRWAQTLRGMLDKTISVE